ncbi:MAG: protein-tyrosine phosphatase family protein [Kiritimatiellia bacterium]
MRFFAHRSTLNDAGIFRQIPLKVRGGLYVSPMPYGAYDTENRVLKLYKDNHIGHVFIIATDDEIKKKSRKDIKKAYEFIGATYSQLAVPDMTAPSLEEMQSLAKEAIRHLRTTRVAVHCHAGVGRTSTFACCVVQKLTGMSAAKTIAYVKEHMEVNMTTEQEAVVKKFAAKS